jgi:hypothetical protein
VPSAVNRGSNELEDFPCHRHVIVPHCVTSISFLNRHIFAYFFRFGTFLGHSVTLYHIVTLVTNIIVMCHW